MIGSTTPHSFTLPNVLMDIVLNWMTPGLFVLVESIIKPFKNICYFFQVANKVSVENFNEFLFGHRITRNRITAKPMSNRIHTRKRAGGGTKAQIKPLVPPNKMKIMSTEPKLRYFT